MNISPEEIQSTTVILQDYEDNETLRKQQEFEAKFVRIRNMLQNAGLHEQLLSESQIGRQNSDQEAEKLEYLMTEKYVSPSQLKKQGKRRKIAMETIKTKLEQKDYYEIYKKNGFLDEKTQLLQAPKNGLKFKKGSVDNRQLDHYNIPQLKLFTTPKFTNLTSPQETITNRNQSFVQTTTQIIPKEPSFGNRLRMFCEYDKNVYRNYKQGKMIKMFFDEKLKNKNIKLKGQLQPDSQPSSIQERVKKELKNKSIQELFEQVQEEQKQIRKHRILERQRLRTQSTILKYGHPKPILKKQQSNEKIELIPNSMVLMQDLNTQNSSAMNIKELNIEPPQLFGNGFNPMKTDMMFGRKNSEYFDLQDRKPRINQQKHATFYINHRESPDNENDSLRNPKPHLVPKLNLRGSQTQFHSTNISPSASKLSTTNRYYQNMHRKVSDIQLLKGLANNNYSALSHSTMLVPIVSQQCRVEENQQRLNSSRFFLLKKEVNLQSQRKSNVGNSDSARQRSETKTRYNQSFLDPVPSHRVAPIELSSTGTNHFRRHRSTITYEKDPQTHNSRLHTQLGFYCDTKIEKSEFTLREDLDWIFSKQRDKYEREAIEEYMQGRQDPAMQKETTSRDPNEVKRFLKFLKMKRLKG